MDWLIIILSVLVGTIIILAFTIVIAIKKIDNMYKDLENLVDLEDDNDVL